MFVYYDDVVRCWKNACESYCDLWGWTIGFGDFGVCIFRVVWVLVGSFYSHTNIKVNSYIRLSLLHGVIHTCLNSYRCTRAY